MSSFRYVVSSLALDDLDGVYRYIFSYGGPDLVADVARRFREAFRSLASNPYAHPVYLFEPPVHTRHEYRSINVYNYKAFYWLDERRGLVVVSRVCHKSADFTRRGL